MTSTIPYGLDISLPSGDHGNTYHRLAEILGVTGRRMAEQGCEPEIRELLQGRIADPLSFREMTDAERIKCCPIAYAICRHAGYDPAAIILLERLSCLVEVAHPHWASRLTAYASTPKGQLGTNLNAPMAQGVIWRSRAAAYKPTIHIDTTLAGLPETVLVSMADRLLGRPLGEFISHPVTDPLGLVISEITEVGDTMVKVGIHPPPEAVGLDEAVARLLAE